MEERLVTIVDREDRSYGINASNLVDSGVVEEVKSVAKKRSPGRPRKNQEGALVPTNSYTDIVTVDQDNFKKKKETYEDKIEKGYYPQVRLIANVLSQTEQLYQNVENQLSFLRDNKSAGGKTRQMAMAELQNTQVSLINTKLSAIREMNSIRNKINDLGMKHEQFMKGIGEENSDKAVMDSYYALINAPRYGLPTFAQPLHPSTINTGVNLQGGAVPTAPIITTLPGESQIAQPLPTQNLNPIQQRMVAEKNPNIKSVVVYNQETGEKYFDVVDVTTGVSVPGIERPAQFLLDDMIPDFRNGVATNSNANLSYPMVVRGNRAVDEL